MDSTDIFDLSQCLDTKMAFKLDFRILYIYAKKLPWEFYSWMILIFFILSPHLDMEDPFKLCLDVAIVFEI